MLSALVPFFWSDGSLMFQPHCLASSAWLDSVAAKEALGNQHQSTPAAIRAGAAQPPRCAWRRMREQRRDGTSTPNHSPRFHPAAPGPTMPKKPASSLSGTASWRSKRQAVDDSDHKFENGQDPVRLTPRATDDAVRGRWKHASNHSIT